MRAYDGGLYLEPRTSDARTVIDSHQIKQVRMGDERLKRGMLGR